MMKSVRLVDSADVFARQRGSIQQRKSRCVRKYMNIANWRCCFERTWHIWEKMGQKIS